MVQSKLTIFLLLLLIFSRVGAIAHAAEHSIDHDHGYCEICALSDHQSDGLIKTKNIDDHNSYRNSYVNPFQQNYFQSQTWYFLTRAPPEFILKQY